MTAAPRTELGLTLRRQDAMLMYDLLIAHSTADLAQHDQDAYARILEAIDAPDC